MSKRGHFVLAAVFTVVAVMFSAQDARAHCDTMDGPVISAAKQALDSGDINLVLVWVQPKDDAAIRDEFARARQARAAGGAARERAEQSFYEALVRIHRAGEGAPYTGVKPEGAEVNPAVRAADQALVTRTVEPVRAALTNAVQAGIEKKFRAALDASSYRPDDVAAGRAYVRAYVEFTHYAEGLYDKAAAPVAHHAEGGDAHGSAHAGHGVTAGGDAHAAHASHASHLSHLPWILAVALGLVSIGQTGWIIRLRRRG